MENNLYHHLQPGQLARPWLAAEELTGLFELPVCREYLWDWFKIYTGSDYAEGMSHIERSRHIVLYEHLLRLVEAVYLLNGQQNGHAFP